eukprot:s2621_g2.t1
MLPIAVIPLCQSCGILQSLRRAEVRPSVAAPLVLPEATEGPAAGTRSNGSKWIAAAGGSEFAAEGVGSFTNKDCGLAGKQLGEWTWAPAASGFKTVGICVLPGASCRAEQGPASGCLPGCCLATAPLDRAFIELPSSFEAAPTAPNDVTCPATLTDNVCLHSASPNRAGAVFILRSQTDPPMEKPDSLETSKRIERVLFDFEELKLRWAAAHARVAEKTRLPARELPPANPDDLELLRRRVTELESALQAASLRLAEQGAKVKAQASIELGPLPVPAPAKPAAAAAAKGKELRHEAMMRYLMEKLEETLTDRRRYFDRYTTLRELVLSRSSLPHVAESAARASGEALSEMESKWILSDQALLEARLLRARGRHRSLFESVRRKEYQVDEALRCAEARRPTDAAREELFQRLGVLPAPAVWRWAGKETLHAWGSGDWHRLFSQAVGPHWADSMFEMLEFWG